MLKIARDQRFHWCEPFAFARARTVGDDLRSRLLATLGYFVAFAAMLAWIDVPKDAAELGVLALFAAVMALFIAWIVVPVFSRLPNDVLVASNRIVVGREVMPFTSIEHAIVGTTRLGEREFRVLTFRTKDGRDHLFGLGRKVDAHALAAFLESVGIHEPR